MVEEQPEPADDMPLEDRCVIDAVDESRRFQFSLIALFALTTGAAFYFCMERLSEGHFAAGTLLVSGVAIPMGLVVLWIGRLFIEGSEPWATILFVLGLGGAIMACLLLTLGF